MSIKPLQVVIALSLALATSGCVVRNIHSGVQANHPERNEVPIASNFASSRQLKLQAAEHWRRAALNSADALVKSLQAGGACLPKTGCMTLYVRRSCETSGCVARSCDTVFNNAFHAEFVTALVGLGYPVSATPVVGATLIDIDVQAVAFSANRPQYRYAGRPVEIGPGLWALSDSGSLIDAQGNTAARTSGFDANWFRTEFAAGPTPRNELVITVSATSPQNVYLARNTRVYYTSDADSSHYFCRGGDTASRATTMRIPVVGDCTPGRCSDAMEGKR